MDDTIIRINYKIDDIEYNEVLDLNHNYIFNNNKYDVIDSMNERVPMNFNNYIDYIIYHLSFNNDMSVKKIKQIKIEYHNEYLHVILNQPNYKPDQINGLIPLENALYLNYIIHYKINYNHKLITDTITSIKHKTDFIYLSYNNKHQNVYDILCEVMNIILSNEFLKDNNISYITLNQLENTINHNNNLYKTINRQNMIISMSITIILFLGILCKYFYDYIFTTDSSFF